MPDDSSLQDGIYFRRSNRPGSCYRLALFNRTEGATRPAVRAAIADVWALLHDLKDGKLSDLGEPTPEADAKLARRAKLTCLLAFGARLFRDHPQAPPLVVPLESLRLGALPWATEPGERTGEADLAIQLIAKTDLAVERALVEAWLLIQAKKLPLQLVTVYRGFNREDRRSWLGFIDGTSNVVPEQRREVIEVSVDKPRWMLGGTYMAFFQLGLDLAVWRKQSRDQQEILVGRDKLTGCPLTSIDAQGRPVPLGGCPVGAHSRKSHEYINAPAPPPELDQRSLWRSHILRANPNRTGVADGDNRIFRQGYEFVESLTEGKLRFGVNFVSFQRDLQRLMNILNQPTWLGGANFGGDGDVKFVSLIDGGFYAVPPRDTPFPGARLFD